MTANADEDPGGHDDEMIRAVENLTGRTVHSLDCIVVLGRDFLESECTEDEVAEIVLRDLATHINLMWPIADRSTGWVGRHLGWATVVGMLTMSHPVLRGDVLRNPLDGLREAVVRMMAQCGYRTDDLDPLRAENGPAIEAMNLILDRIHCANGGLSLPASVNSIIEEGRIMLSAIVNYMDRRPIGII